MTEEAQSGTLTTEQGAERIKSLMFPETPAPSQEPPEGQAEEEVQDEQEPQEYEGEEPESDEGEPLPEMYSVKVDGEEKQVTLDELIKGYQLESHYTQKSQKLAEEQKVVAEERKILSGIHTRFEQLNDVVTYLQGVNSYLESTIPAAPSIDLAKTNPAEYIQQKEAREIYLRNMGSIANQVEQTKAQAKAIVAEMQAAGAQVIRQKMPELLESQNISGLYSYLQSNYGYDKDVIDNNVDPNLFIMAEKARRYDDMMSKAAKPDYVKEKTFKPKPKPQARQGQSQQKAVMSKFKENPTTENAARAIRELLG